MHRRIVLRGDKDRDLVLLYKNVGPAQFSRITKDALRVLIRGNWQTRAELPGLLDTSLPTEDVEFYLCITSENDTDIVDLLNHVRNRKVAEFIRLAIRYYIGAAIILHTFLEDDYGREISENNIPKQVFAIGGSYFSPTRAEKPRKRKSNQKKTTPKKEKPIPTTSTPVYQTETISSPNTIPIMEEEVLPQTPEMNADDMLALLEGLL